jgi:hypothetical protein
MIWLMARSQMEISKNPRMGARCRYPRETKMTRMVPRETSQIRARKMRMGRTTQVKRPDSRKETVDGNPRCLKSTRFSDIR